jgi:hypothetical protein
VRCSAACRGNHHAQNAITIAGMPSPIPTPRAMLLDWLLLDWLLLDWLFVDWLSFELVLLLVSTAVVALVPEVVEASAEEIPY